MATEETNKARGAAQELPAEEPQIKNEAKARKLMMWATIIVSVIVVGVIVYIYGFRNPDITNGNQAIGQADQSPHIPGQRLNRARPVQGCGSQLRPPCRQPRQTQCGNTPVQRRRLSAGSLLPQGLRRHRRDNRRRCRHRSRVTATSTSTTSTTQSRASNQLSASAMRTRPTHPSS